MANGTFIFRSEWMDNIKNLDPEIQAKIIYDIAAYGCGRDPLFIDDPVISTMVNFVKGSIDFSKDKYEAKAHGGSKKKFKDEEIYNLAHKMVVERGKASAQEVADILGCSKSTIDNSTGWKMRFRDTYAADGLV